MTEPFFTRECVSIGKIHLSLKDRLCACSKKGSLSIRMYVHTYYLTRTKERERESRECSEIGGWSSNEREAARRRRQQQTAWLWSHQPFFPVSAFSLGAARAARGTRPPFERAGFFTERTTILYPAVICESEDSRNRNCVLD